MAELGWMGLIIPQEYGGSSGSFLDLMVLLEEAGQGCLVSPMFSTVICTSVLLDIASEEQKREFLPKIASGEKIFTLALTEPSALYDASGIETTAIQKNDGYKINGMKLFVNDAQVADYFICVTKTDPSSPPEEGITLFLVDAKSEGVKVTPLPTIADDKQNEVVFEDVPASEEDILGGSDALNKGWRQLLATLDVEHLELAACAIGVAQGAFEEAVQYAKDREQFGQPISRFQVIQHKLVDMATQIHQARLALYHTIWLAEQGKPFSLESAMTKYVATEAAKHVALDGMQIHGGYGYMME